MQSDTDNRIETGRRVICRRHGPHDGKRGKVVSVFAGQAQVEFEATSVCFPLEYFEPV